MQVQSLVLEDPLQEGTVTDSSTPAWRIPWIEEPCGLQSIESQSLTQLKQINMHAHEEGKEDPSTTKTP